MRKAVGPDGKVYLVGSGSSTIKVEKEFVREAVDAAAQLLQRRGRVAAFQELKEPGSRFQFLGSYIFVLDNRGALPHRPRLSDDRRARHVGLP